MYWKHKLILFFSLCILYCSSAHSSTLSASLSSGWSTSPIELQFSEWIAQRGSTYFWQFVNDLFQRELALESDQESFAWCEQWIARHWDVASGQVAVWSVLAVEQLGTVLLQNQWATHVWRQRTTTTSNNILSREKPKIFAEYNDQLYTHLDTLLSHLQSSNHEKTSHLSLDMETTGHSYPSVVHRNIPLVILYGHIGKMEMKPWHDALFSMAKDGNICYIIRHSFESINRSIYLQGYGVEVFIKNTEYLVQDPLAYPCPSSSQRHMNRSYELDISTISDQRCLLQGDCYSGGIIDWPILENYYSLSREETASLQNALDIYLEQLSSSAIKDLKPWQVQDIGLSATHAIVHSKDPLLMLERIANNLPLYAPLLAGPLHISDSQALDYRHILQSLEDQEEQVVLNGRSLSLPWGLLPPTLTKCMDAIALARNMWLNLERKRSHIQLDNYEWWNTSSSKPCIRLSLNHPDSPVVFIQNEDDIPSLLKETKGLSYSSVVFYEYASYLRSLEILSSSHLLDVIFVWDPLDSNQLVVTLWMKQVLEQGWPIRIGIALIPGSESHEDQQDNSSSMDWNAYIHSSEQPSDVWYHLASHYYVTRNKKSSLQQDDDDAMAEMILLVLKYLTTEVPCPIAGYYFLAKLKQEISVPMDLFSLLSAGGGGGMASYERLQWNHLQRAFLFAYAYGFSCTSRKQQHENISQDLWTRWMNNSSDLSCVKKHRQWANAMGFQRLPMVIVNGIPLTDVTSQLVITLEQEMKNMLKPGSQCTCKWIPRQNARLQGQGIAPYTPSTLKEILQQNEYHHCKYFKTKAAMKQETNSTELATIWIVVDLDSLQGWKWMALALEWLLSPLSVPGRVAFLHTNNGFSDNGWSNEQQRQLQQMKQLVIKQMQKGLETKSDYEFLSYIPLVSDQRVHKNRVFINGFEYSLELFTFPTDFDLACSIMKTGLVTDDPDTQLLWSFTSRWLDQSCTLSFSRPGTSVFSSSSSSTNLRADEWKQVLGQSYDLLSFHSTSSSSIMDNNSGNERQCNDTNVFYVEAILDPLSPVAAKAATLLSILREYFDVSISVLLLPSPYTSIETIQRSSFYRTVLVPRPRFETGTGALISKPSGVFEKLFRNRTLTVSMDTPPKWLIGASHAEEDLDNLVLQNDTHIHAEYRLEAILVEGICIDVSNKSSSFPPQGLSLSLVPWTSSNWIQTQDTLVMANLGYFQFQTNLGVWNLQIGQRQGIAYELVKMEENNIADTSASIALTLISASSVSNIVSPQNSPNLFLLVQQLQGKSLTLYVRPIKKGSSSSHFQLSPIIPSWLSKLLDRSHWFKYDQQLFNDDRKVHVFSVASGYLYERLIRIMMLSVVKHSSVPVKFWLLKNYLSPNFKKILPHFAATCGFEYQLVTYRWPAWLTAQTEKQRIMWAYKILFLDVLFPLNLSRVVFVDSDQVVRGDLYELFQMDLHGAPYGYVPFCDSRKEVEGYRFWKQGFWASLLQNQKYRISALYVVDLKQFRKMAAGDNLRAIYQRLVQDPGSLSNLDQDLPNFASVPQPGLPHVPIYDLPPEWLWCETWCDDESKKRAKTIDLCNNPMTKEHKLSSAKRIIPEWIELDKEATEIVVQALCPTSSLEKPNENTPKVAHEEL